MSRSAARLVCTLALSILALPCAAADAPAGPKSVDAAWVKAMKANDLEGVMKCYAPNAVVWFPGETEARGEKAIRELYTGFLGANRVQDVVLSDDHEEISGDVCGRWGHFQMTIVPKAGGAPVTMTGRFTEVLKKKGGRWVYVADHASDDPPPKTPPEKA